MARKRKKYKTRTKADVEASLRQIRVDRETAPTHEEIGPVLEAAARLGYSVAQQAELTGIERRHIYKRHGDVALPGLYNRQQPEGTQK